MATDDLKRGILIGLGMATVQGSPADMFCKLHHAWGFEHDELTTPELRHELALILHEDDRRH